MKSRSSNDARKEWADVQADAMAGTPTAIERHDRRTCVVMPPEWGDFYSDAYWLRIMEDARQKFPGKDDPELMKEVLQRWAWQQGCEARRIPFAPERDSRDRNLVRR